MNSNKVFGGKIHIYGDLHLSCVYEGQHKDYTLESYMNMDNIIRKVQVDKPSAVFFLGDLIGVNERNIKDRQFFLRVYLFLKTLNDMTNGNVYTVKGNHDKGDFSDFDFFIGASLLKNPDYVDYYGCSKGEYDSLDEDVKDEGLEIRFHFVNYGEEYRELHKTDPSIATNVVLGHADYLVEGVTNWYAHKNGVTLAHLKNFSNVELIISGHIHTPSIELLSTPISGGTTAGLFYTGSPSRTAERFDDCWYLVFEFQRDSDVQEGSTRYDALPFGLRPADDVFYPKEDFELSDEDEGSQIKESQALTDIVREIMEGRMTSGDLFSQVMAVPGASDEVKKIACDYLHKAIDMG